MDLRKRKKDSFQEVVKLLGIATRVVNCPHNGDEYELQI